MAGGGVTWDYAEMRHNEARRSESVWNDLFKMGAQIFVER